MLTCEGDGVRSSFLIASDRGRPVSPTAGDDIKAYTDVGVHGGGGGQCAGGDIGVWMLVAEEPVSMWKSLHGDASEEESELKEGAYTQLTSSSSCSEADKGRGKEGSEGESEGAVVDGECGGACWTMCKYAH